MIRAFVAVGGMVLLAVGIIMTLGTLTVNGWWLLAALGWGLLWLDQRLDERGADL